MVGGTHQQQPQQQQAQLAPPPPPSSSTAPTTTPEEEEFLKRNTDCVYFLASPLTCKKGSECEYRHSDIARVNPRDCWYWLNGNCLNPKCAFRHPPLDGLLGAEVPTPMAVPPLQTPAAAPLASTYGMPKQGVSCIFFQKGFCLKGHLCPFLHGSTSSVSNKTVQSGPANPVSETPKMAFANPEKSTQEQKFVQQKPVEFPPQGKQATRTQPPQPTRNGGSGAIEKKIPLQTTSSMIPEEPPRYKSASVVNEMSASRPSRGVHQAHHVSDNDSTLNGKDTDEYSREPSPGFDVLVNEVGDSEYYHNEEQFGRSSGHDYDIGRSTEFDVDRDVYREQRDFDHYNERGRYGWEDHRVSSAHLERKRYNPRDSPDQVDESDLRHRISKQRRGNNGNNGLRSIVSREHARESYADRVPRRDSHMHRQDHRQDQGSTLSSRLRGRIKIPGRSTSPTNERPPYASSNQSRLRDRIKGKVSEDYHNERRDFRGPRGRVDNDAEFTGPKRLSELKSGKSESYEPQLNDRLALGKRKFPRGELQQSEDDLSFEGPKPLSEILKRKRGSETTAPDNSCKEIKENEENDLKERKEILPGSTVHTNKEESNSVSPELGEAEKQTGSTATEKDKPIDASELETEEGLIDEDAMLDQELEAYDHKDGDYDYEQIDGEDYNMDEAENPDEEYLDEEDGDDYTKKESVVYS